MTIEIEPTILAEIKEQAKTWLDYEAQIHERVLKEKRWDVIDVQECKTMGEVCMGTIAQCKTMGEVCMGTIAHRIMEALYPEEYQKVMGLMLNALNEVKENEEQEVTH